MSVGFVECGVRKRGWGFESDGKWASRWVRDEEVVGVSRLCFFLDITYQLFTH